MVGVSSLDLAGAFGLRPPLEDEEPDTRDGAARAARGDQGDGGDWATALPSQSVEKVVPEATGDGDGLTSASGPGFVPGSNSPDGASESGSTAHCREPQPKQPMSGDSWRDSTQLLSVWARAGLQNQAPGARLLPAVPTAGGA